MAKITSKYQVTLPKRIADRYQLHPGDEIDWVPAGEVIRVIPAGKEPAGQDREARLRLFDHATTRHRARRAAHGVKAPPGRGWRREDLYTRGRSD